MYERLNRFEQHGSIESTFCAAAPPVVKQLFAIANSGAADGDMRRLHAVLDTLALLVNKTTLRALLVSNVGVMSKVGYRNKFGV